MFKRTTLIMLMIMMGLAVACTPPVAQPTPTPPAVEPTPVPPVVEETPTPPVAHPGEVGGYVDLVDALRAAGATVEPVSAGEESIFDVSVHWRITVNGATVDVFEFADEATREEAAATISAAGDTIGTIVVEWIDLPNFWSEGRLIVLYVGRDEDTLDLLTGVLGEPIVGVAAPPEQPEAPAVEAAIEVLSETINVPSEEIEVLLVERAEWPDGCLGLGQPDEMCTLAIVPGYRIILQVDDQEYEVRTDLSGTSVRVAPGVLPPDGPPRGDSVPDTLTALNACLV